MFWGKKSKKKSDVVETLADDIYRTHFRLPEPGSDRDWDERYYSRKAWDESDIILQGGFTK